MRRELACFALVLAAASPVYSQLLASKPWEEAETPAPAPVETRGLIDLDIPDSGLRFGVAPGSITIGSDGVVRYVVVARGGSGVTAMYEGIRCNTGEYKVYARDNAGAGWQPVAQSTWRSLDQRPVPRHTKAIARTGACVGSVANFTAADIVRDLRQPGSTLER